MLIKKQTTWYVVRWRIQNQLLWHVSKFRTQKELIEHIISSDAYSDNIIAKLLLHKYKQGNEITALDNVSVFDAFEVMSSQYFFKDNSVSNLQDTQKLLRADWERLRESTMVLRVSNRERIRLVLDPDTVPKGKFVKYNQNKNKHWDGEPLSIDIARSYNGKDYTPNRDPDKKGTGSSIARFHNLQYGNKKNVLTFEYYGENSTTHHNTGAGNDVVYYKYGLAFNWKKKKGVPPQWIDPVIRNDGSLAP